MARIFQRSGKKGDIWYVDYAVGGRRVRKKLGRSKKLAELAKADIEVKLERQEIGFTRTDARLDDLVAEYLSHAKANSTPNSFALSEQILRQFKEFCRTEQLKDITHLMIERYKNQRKESGCVASSVNRELAVIKAMFNRGVEWGFLSKSPADNVKKFKEPKRQARFFTKEEIGKMLAADHLLRPLISVFVNTGLRRDELLHLTWSDIDFDRKLLIVQAKDGWRPKDYEVRHIPLNAAALDALKEIKGPRDPKALIFRDKNGTAYQATFLSHRFKKLLRKLDIDGHLHALRHTFASHLAMKGTDLFTISKLLGHSSVKTTEIYAHLAPNYLKAAVDKLEFNIQTTFHGRPGGLRHPHRGFGELPDHLDFR